MRNKITVKDIINFVIFAIITLSATHSILFSQWKRVTNIPAAYYNNYYLEISFLTNNHNLGWVCGFNGKVIRTVDGGKTWTGTQINGVNQLECIYFADSLTGFTSGEGKIYKSTDGGVSFFDITDPRATSVLWGNYTLHQIMSGR
jgi:photosystem II stability/assembly factor-like uncharacterized protein